jgi:hypothetical protein
MALQSLAPPPGTGDVHPDPAGGAAVSSEFGCSPLALGQATISQPHWPAALRWQPTRPPTLPSAHS